MITSPAFLSLSILFYPAFIKHILRPCGAFSPFSRFLVIGKIFTQLTVFALFAVRIRQMAVYQNFFRTLSLPFCGKCLILKRFLPDPAAVFWLDRKSVV